MTHTPSLHPLQALAEKARAATPGEWFIHPKDLEAVNNRTTHRGQLVIHGITDGAREEDAAYIVAAQPSAILALVEEVIALRSAVKPFAREAERWPTTPSDHCPIMCLDPADADEDCRAVFTIGELRALAALDHGSRGT